MRIIDIFRKNNIECLPNERFTLDVEMFTDIGEANYYPKHVLFENPTLKGYKKRVPIVSESIFKYFLDGSQRSHKLIDAVFENRYLPICGGQIGVAVLCRNGRKLIPCQDLITYENILAVPNILEKENTIDLQDQINKGLPDKYRFRLVRYDSKSKTDKDPADLGRALIIHEMQLLELKTIREMIKQNYINSDSLLAKDGGLQYRDDKIRDLNLSNDDIPQLRNVIGLAKTFKPSLTLGVGRGRQDIGKMTMGLDIQERSTVISPNKNESNTHGWWYLRLRPRSKIYSPLQGIIKIEVFADETEKQNNGINESRADTISSYVFHERNVTPYGADTRWASHIYPIYLAETYLKSSFLGHARFKSLVI